MVNLYTPSLSLSLSSSSICTSNRFSNVQRVVQKTSFAIFTDGPPFRNVSLCRFSTLFNRKRGLAEIIRFTTSFQAFDAINDVAENERLCMYQWLVGFKPEISVESCALRWSVLVKGRCGRFDLIIFVMVSKRRASSSIYLSVSEVCSDSSVTLF